jgi:hypothetical protein
VHWHPSEHDVPVERMATQLVPMQTLPVAHCVAAHPPEQLVQHAPEPLHVYLPQPLSGSVPAVRAAHVPRLALRLHATQGPEQVVSQQTPSTQLPERHSHPSAQVAPRSFFAVQVSPAQYAASVSQSMLAQAPEQVVLQEPAPSQPYRPHTPSGSVPAAWS